jgi:hypothetical protein
LCSISQSSRKMKKFRCPALVNIRTALLCLKQRNIQIINYLCVQLVCQCSDRPGHSMCTKSVRKTGAGFRMYTLKVGTCISGRWRGRWLGYFHRLVLMAWAKTCWGRNILRNVIFFLHTGFFSKQQKESPSRVRE